MMRASAKTTELTTMNRSSAGGNMSRVGDAGEEWEMRPGGMLVQKRNAGSDHTSAPPPTIRVRVKHGSMYHEISINSQATFGELKKMLTGPTGLHHQDQKLLFKDKERDSKAFLDMVGVKDRSKIVLLEDPISQEKRLLEMRRNAKMEKASKSISEISLQVDRLAGRVSAMESVISRGGKIPETEVLTLIELLMNQLLQLDGIIADGDVKLQRKMQVRRVQKYVETLDSLKIKNSMQAGSGVQAQAQEENKQAHADGVKTTAIQHQQQKRHQNGHAHSHSHSQPPANHHHQRSNHHQNRNKKQEEAEEEDPRGSTSGTVVTTKWETFDAAPPLVPARASSTTSTTSPVAINNNPVQPRFNWELFE